MDSSDRERLRPKHALLKRLSILATLATMFAHMPRYRSLQRGMGTPMVKYRGSHTRIKWRGPTRAQKATKDYIMKQHKLEKKLKRRRQRRLNYKGRG